MLQFVTNLISMGYAAGQILNFISKKVKGLDKGIETARYAGHSDENILKFLSGKMPKAQGKEYQRALNDQEQYLKNVGIKTKSEKQEQSRKGINAAIGLGSAALGAYGLYNQYAKRFPKPEWDFTRHPVPKEALQIEGGAQPQLGYNPGFEKGPAGPNQFQMKGFDPIQPPQQLIQNAKQPRTAPTTPVPPIAATSPSVMPTAQPQTAAPVAPKVPAKLKLENLGLLNRADAMLKAGNAPDIVAGTLIAQAPPQLKNSLKSPIKQKQIQDAVSEYAQELQQGQPDGQVNEIPGEIQPSPEQGTADPLQLSNTSQETAKTPEAETNKGQGKGDVVALSSGEIGTIEDLKKDHAVVEVEGKKRPVKLDQIEDLSINQKDLADLHDELINEIEKTTGQDVSRNVEWSGYDPKTNQLAFKPHDGSLYIYDDISPEDIEKLTNILSVRKSSGGNFIGSWQAGTKSPIGAEMYQLLKKLQGERGGKGNEYSGKFQTVYHAYEPAVKASKQKKKDEERKRKEKKR